MEKLFIVTVKAFGKHVEEKVAAKDRDEATHLMAEKYGVLVKAKPYSYA